jgi:Heavy metal associated domain 2
MKQAHIAHHLPGRIRIKIPAAKDDPALLGRLQQMFAGMPNLHAVATKPESGSLVLRYDPDHEAEFEQRMLLLLKETLPGQAKKANDELPGNEFDAVTRNIEAEAALLAGRSQAAHAVIEFCKDVDHQLKLATNNAVDLKIVIAFGLAVATFVGIGVHAATPMWVTLALFAIHHFLEMHPPIAVPPTVAYQPHAASLVAA